MEFREKQAIYMQIADYFRSNILLDKWLPEEKVPSIRQLAVELEVNPNTVMRTYSYLQETNIIYNKRGIGYFVSPDAKNAIVTIMKKKFIEYDLPLVFRNMNMLDISINEMEKLFADWKKTNIKKTE